MRIVCDRCKNKIVDFDYRYKWTHIEISEIDYGKLDYYLCPECSRIFYDFLDNKEGGINIDKDELLKALAYDRQQYEKGYNNAIDDFKIRFFCKLNNRVVRPIFSKQIQSKFTIDDIKSIFDEIVEQLRVGEQE